MEEFHILQDNQESVDVDASSSLPSLSAELSPRWKHDVFLSFRGVDTRRGIAFEIYDRLQNRRGIKTFMDDQDLEVGDVISPALLTAIKESRFAIIILSPNYASSTWCLEELRNICERMEDNNRILPLFYNVNPTEVRYQEGTFEDAFIKLENSGRQRSEKVQQWRDALEKVASYTGWHTLKYKTDRELVDAIEEFVCRKVQLAEIDSIEDFQEFKATRQAMDEVLKKLKDDQVTVVGVYGMRGVGKTTMVKHVGAEARKSRLFDKVIMAFVSQNPDLRKIQGTFADLLGFKFEEDTEIGRARKLKEKIMRGTRILIILDDIWKRIEFSSIGIPSHDELQRCNSKVLLTTRRLSVCCSMDSHANIPLNILSEEDSWSLLVKKARMSFDKSSNFHDVAREVARKCAGLPIALIEVARAVRDEGLDEWKVAAQRLTANSVVKALKDSSLLLDGTDNSFVRMHDVSRDMAKSISSSEDGPRLLVKNWPKINADKGYSALSLMKNEICKLPQELVCPNLQILLLQHNAYLNEIPESFFSSQKELRVLDLSHTAISLLSQSISLLTNLQALYLDSCHNIIDISILGKLNKRKILSMRDIGLEKLSREIGQLTNLRMLDVCTVYCDKVQFHLK